MRKRSLLSRCPTYKITPIYTGKFEWSFKELYNLLAVLVTPKFLPSKYAGIYAYNGARSVVVKALRWQSEGPGIDLFCDS